MVFRIKKNNALFTILYTGFFCLLCIVSNGQPAMLDLVNKHPVIHKDANSLIIPGDSSGFVRLFEKITRIQQGSHEQLHMMHIGGSHVQAGVMSEQIRQNFRHFFPQDLRGERGFLFPYTLAGTNNPWDYSIEFSGSWEGCRNAIRSADCIWGVAGITASTADPYSHVMIKAKDAVHGVHTFCSVRVYYNVNTSPLIPEVINWECPVYTHINKESGYIEWHFDQEQRELEFLLLPDESNQTGIFSLEGIQFMTGYPGSVLHAIGVNGASVPSYLRCSRFRQQLCEFPPDIVFLGIGVNDAHVPQKDFDPAFFKSSYEALIGNILYCNPEAILIFITNNDTYYRKRYPNRNALVVREIMQSLAERYNGGVYDLFGVMGGLQSIVKWNKAGLAKKDYIHFTNDGYRLIGDLIFLAFQEQYNNFVPSLIAEKE
jgi:lysophospholipase L1-like esterase